MPRWNGPGLNFFPPRNLAEIGMENMTYWHATPREKTALIAVGPAKASRPKRSAPTAPSHTEFTGVLVVLLI
jgi:hypothetical protein